MKKNLILLSTFFVTLINMAQNLQVISYQDGQIQHQGEAIIVKPGNAGVLILPAWMGIDNEARTAAKDLAQKGYNVFIADIYGQAATPKTSEDAKRNSSFYKENYQNYRHKIEIALQEFIKLGANKDKIAVIGYCFGGTGTLEAARANLPFTGVVSIHGGLIKVDSTYNKINPKILVVHPAEDQSVSEQDIDLLMAEMRKGEADWQFIYYADSKHTFTNPESKDYNPIMAKRAWQHTLLFLDEVLN